LKYFTELSQTQSYRLSRPYALYPTVPKMNRSMYIELRYFMDSSKGFYLQH